MTSATLATVALAAEETRDIPATPVVWGVVAFAILMLLLIGVLTFGRGRT